VERNEGRKAARKRTISIQLTRFSHLSERETSRFLISGLSKAKRRKEGNIHQLSFARLLPKPRERERLTDSTLQAGKEEEVDLQQRTRKGIRPFDIVSGGRCWFLRSLSSKENRVSFEERTNKRREGKEREREREAKGELTSSKITIIHKRMSTRVETVVES